MPLPKLSLKIGANLRKEPAIAEFTPDKPTYSVSKIPGQNTFVPPVSPTPKISFVPVPKNEPLELGLTDFIVPKSKVIPSGKSQLPATQTIVSELGKTGKPTDFISRENTYKGLGLEAKLGPYLGSPEQNVAVSNYLKAGKTPAGEEAEQPPVVPTPIIEKPPTQDIINQAQLSDVDIGSILNEITTGEFKSPELVLGEEATKLAREQEMANVVSSLAATQKSIAGRGLA